MNTLAPREEAVVAIATIDVTARDLAEAVRFEMQMETAKAIAKSAAVQRLMQVDNPETGKLHSASSAEKVVETDDEFATFRATQIRAVVTKYLALGRYESAKLSARLAVALVEAGVPV